MIKIERWDTLISYGLIALILWGMKAFPSAVENPPGHAEQSAIETEYETKVYPYGKIDGFFVYIVNGLPNDPEEPLLTLTLTPIDEPGCDIVWAMVNDPVHPWSFVGPYGCKGELKSFVYYEQKLIEAVQMYAQASRSEHSNGRTGTCGHFLLTPGVKDPVNDRKHEREEECSPEPADNKAWHYHSGEHHEQRIDHEREESEGDDVDRKREDNEDGLDKKI